MFNVGKFKLENPMTVNTELSIYRADIDGLRAIAVLSVIGYHAFPTLVRGGFIGVDIFFVISGYLISKIIIENLEGNSFSFAGFYIRRIKRIFPALLLVLVVSYAFGWAILMANEYKQLGKHIAAGAGFISNLLLLGEEGYFDSAANSKPLLHLWSLGIEEQFYIIWPMMLYAAFRKNLNFALLIAIIGSISFSLNITLSSINTNTAFYAPHTRFWQLLIGSFLAYLTISGETKKTNRFLAYRIDYSNITSLIGSFLIILGFALITRERSFPSWWALFPTVGTVMIIFAGKEAWINQKILSNRALVWFGLISYPLYLWHWPVLFYMKILLPATSSPRYIFIPVLVSIVLAYATYRLVERPVRYGKTEAKAAIVLSIFMAIIGVVGYATYLFDGFPFRYDTPPFITKLLTTQFDVEKPYRQPECLLTADGDSSSFSEICVEQNKKPLIFLWGDSHAGALYPGLKKLQEKRSFGIAQFTASACPPLVSFEDLISRPNCKGINDANLILIRQLRPDVVVLHARWFGRGYDLSKIDLTVNELKKIGIYRIILFGPVPEWHDSLPNNLVNLWKSNHEFGTPPLRTRFGERTNIFYGDKQLRAIADSLSITYISPIEAMCNLDGCLTRVGDDPTDLTAIDYGHLSPKGSSFLIDTISNDLFGDSGLGRSLRSP
jgi:peptidoglycan/LPS O-acetylase OafA/YrhL